MGNQGLTKEDLNVILSGYRSRNLSEYVLSTAEEDLTSGLSKSQVDLYAGRRLPDTNVKAMSEALHMGASQKLVRKLANMDEYRLKIVLAEIKGGMSEERILHVLSKDATAHGMQQLFSQLKMDMANTEEKKEPDMPKEEDSGKAQEPAQNRKDIAYRTEDIVKVMEPVFIRFTEGISEALKPGMECMSRMADHMNELETKLARDLGQVQEDRLNEEIDRLEKQVKELQRDLASSAGVIKSRETEIGRLKEEMAMIKESRTQGDAAIAGRTRKSGGSNVDYAGGEAYRENLTGLEHYVWNAPGGQKLDHGISAGMDLSRNAGVASGNRKDAGPGKKPRIAASCQAVLKTPDGTKIPVQIERTEVRRPKGVMAMAAKLFNGTQSQKALLKMLIDKRLSPEQLKEIKRAKDHHFADDELTDLIESDLPAEEMAGIIDVILADRRQVV